MRTFIAGLIVCVAFTGMAAAQEEELRAKHQAKLEKKFMHAIPWFTRYDKAIREAKFSKKPVFAYFTRSYAP